MKIAVLYVCIGNYDVMWDGFYKSAKEYFFNDSEVHYFVFTDSKKIKKEDDMTITEVKNYGWPGNTLYRFRFFLMVKEQLAEYDYAFFFNANASFVKPVNKEILPEDSNVELIGVPHFKFFGHNKMRPELERRKKSTAYVKWGCEPNPYCQACFIGATAKMMIKMSEELDKRITIDENNNIVALWHDESHFNKYLTEHAYKFLTLSYAYPESVKPEGYEPIILMRNKENFAELNVLRYGKKRTLFQYLSFKTRNQIRKINIWFHIFLHKFKRG